MRSCTQTLMPASTFYFVGLAVLKWQLVKQENDVHFSSQIVKQGGQSSITPGRCKCFFLAEKVTLMLYGEQICIAIIQDVATLTEQWAARLARCIY